MVKGLTAHPTPSSSPRKGRGGRAHVILGPTRERGTHEERLTLDHPGPGSQGPGQAKPQPCGGGAGEGALGFRMGWGQSWPLGAKHGLEPPVTCYLSPPPTPRLVSPRPPQNSRPVHSCPPRLSLQKLRPQPPSYSGQHGVTLATSFSHHPTSKPVRKGHGLRKSSHFSLALATAFV